MQGTLRAMTKRARALSTPSLTSESSAIAENKPTSVFKKARIDVKFLPNKIATVGDAAKADRDPPFLKLEQELRRAIKTPVAGDAVVYWMRMEDMRVNDNRALSQASEQAVKDKVPLLALFVLSPQDYIAHDRSPRRIDFTLRNLREIQRSLAELHIPLHVVTHTPRATLPSKVVSTLTEWKVNHLFANIEYGVDELRRDIKVCELSRLDGKVNCTFIHDKCIIAPGLIKSKQEKPYSVYSPFLRAWIPQLTDKSDPLACAPSPKPNAKSIHNHAKYGRLFDTQVPASVEGFELDSDDARQMELWWKAGEDTAHEMLNRFLYTKARHSQFGAVDPLSEGAVVADKDPSKSSRVGKYKDARDRVDADTTSRLSPYLAAGVISARHCIRATLEFSSNNKIDVSRETGVGRWVQELAWRDFYTHVLAQFPRVSMGRPFQEKFSDVKWEVNEEHLQAWKDGRTGVPIVDAGMRQAKLMGWMHNRVRMITAMYLVKDLMLDWRLGEKHFMEVLIDGDLASNNGGWQWSASTGVDPAPYFRIFNPYTQSEKADPTGEYIRYFVPELAKLKGDDLHHPSPKVAEKLGYPVPFVKHEEARERAIRRYKTPGGV